MCVTTQSRAADAYSREIQNQSPTQFGTQNQDRRPEQDTQSETKKQTTICDHLAAPDSRFKVRPPKCGPQKSDHFLGAVFVQEGRGQTVGHHPSLPKLVTRKRPQKISIFRHKHTHTRKQQTTTIQTLCYDSEKKFTRTKMRSTQS